MLHITTAQLQKLARIARERTDSALVDHMRRRFPDGLKNWEDANIQTLVSIARSQAADHKIYHEKDIATVLDLTIMYGAAPFNLPWARDILSLADVSGAERMELLRRRMRTVLPGF